MANNATSPTSVRVAANIRELRRARGLDLADVSARMTAYGRPLSLSGLSKVERGQRGVDVDDLVAIALALDVAPNRLLLTQTASVEGRVQLTPEVSLKEPEAWEWACGDDFPLLGLGFTDDVNRAGRFPHENRPHDPPDETSAKDLLEHTDELRAIAQAINQLEKQGLGRKTILSYVESLSPSSLLDFLSTHMTADEMRAAADRLSERYDRGER